MGTSTHRVRLHSIDGENVVHKADWSNVDAKKNKEKAVKVTANCMGFLFPELNNATHALTMCNV